MESLYNNSLLFKIKRSLRKPKHVKSSFEQAQNILSSSSVFIFSINNSKQ